MLSHVTFTGWDRHTDLDELTTFLEDCPQDRVEIAVLYSARQEDDDRYPQVEKAREILRAAKAAGQRSAVHICGRAARDFLVAAEEDGEGVRVFSPAAPLIHYADRTGQRRGGVLAIHRAREIPAGVHRDAGHRPADHLAVARY